ncbi:HlyD family type I secretion periplasmic adaptor subunit [Rhizosaccharibacter radicis]|uniref:Membrane fusion protein (MFP) family protein n=1 Tax=Rhizosaccharibacter radicis TaxID=2782605 RepID=A0ABT1VTI4_9PROT|nr:HlyD family type I secretion periplasmic adaptor subunit [Acetobacteraceae bacterium KSS12]
MSGSTDIVPADRNNREVGPPRRRREDDDMPAALLEFHSPSAALAALPPSATARYTTWIISSLAIASIMVLALFPVDRVVVSAGGLVPTTPMLVVQPLDNSIVRSIDVREGDVVHKGQVLARFDPTASGADFTALQSQTANLTAQVARLKAEVSGKDYTSTPDNPASIQEAANFLRRKANYDAKLHDFDQQIAAAQNDLVGYQASAAMYAGRVKVATDVHNMRVQLQKDQVGSRLNSLASQDELMEIERSQINAQQSAAAARNKIASLQAQRQAYMDGFRADSYQQLAEAQLKLYQSTGDLAKAQLHNGLIELKAERDAIVLNIAHLSVGSVVTAAQQFMTLVPLDAPLEVEARMPADEAGYVKLGDKANVKFAAFDYNQHGGAEATVTHISANSFSEAQTQADAASAPANGLGTAGDSSGKSFYRVRMRIDRYTLRDVPKYFKPIPGMPLTADIKVGKRTILQYMLGSVLPLASDGMRDPQ